MQRGGVFSQLYATALMGLAWTLFLLIEERDEDPAALHPITDVRSILFPPVALLSLPMIAAALINRDKYDASFVTVLIFSLLGFAAGLLVVAAVTSLGLLIARCINFGPFSFSVWQSSPAFRCCPL